MINHKLEIFTLLKKPTTTIFINKLILINIDITEDEFKKLQQIAKYLQKSVEEAELREGLREGGNNNNNNNNNGYDSYKTNKEYRKPEFDYVMEGKPEESEFAVNPSDPRYFGNFKDYNSNILRNSEMDNTNNNNNNNVNNNNDVVFETSKTSRDTNNKETSSSYLDSGVPIVAGCTGAAIVCIIVIGISCYR
ncbi:conserved hypothetical protein [Pediculus humanus corporis]|uniref:Uncharacterized protein n=1 Tax=Pediculus humanus subsp. corporis TaxID=121224 RepID=E0VXH7_PEDHC|nr:uncharacterized protein Phum_PHUM500590 [Pediculus humanus corporis]EEB18083.1 conserved hypothetical protein [Pediculus humanus corporis]